MEKVLGSKAPRMSLQTHQNLLKERSIREDALHRFAVGEDSKELHALLEKTTKKIAELEAKFKAEKLKFREKAQSNSTSLGFKPKAK